MLMVKLIRLESTHNNLRTNEVEGTCEVEPRVGMRFDMTGRSLTVDGYPRYVSTSPVTEVVKVDRGWLFKTANSSYELEITGFADDFLTPMVLADPKTAAEYYKTQGVIPSREGGFSQKALDALKPFM